MGVALASVCVVAGVGVGWAMAETNGPSSKGVGSTSCCALTELPSKRAAPKPNNIVCIRIVFLKFMMSTSVLCLFNLVSTGDASGKCKQRAKLRASVFASSQTIETIELTGLGVLQPETAGNARSK